MTIELLNGAMWIPWQPPFSNDDPTLGTSTIDAAGERISFILRATKSGTLDQFEFRLSNVNLDNGSTVKFSFQDLDSSGNPDGTADQYRVKTPNSHAWNTTGILSDDGTDTGVKRSVNRGDMIACVIEWNSFVSAPDALNARYIQEQAEASYNLPNAVKSYTGGAWSLITNAVPVVALKYDDATYGFLPGCIPANTLEKDTIGSDATTQEEWGMAISLPAPLLVAGGLLRYETNDNPTTGVVTLYDHDFSTVLEQIPLYVTSISRYISFLFTQGPYDGSYLFAANEVYRIVVSFLDTANDSAEVHRFTVGSTNLLQTVEGGTSFYFTHRTGTSPISDDSWVDDLTSRPFMSLMVVGLDHQTGGG